MKSRSAQITYQFKINNSRFLIIVALNGDREIEYAKVTKKDVCWVIADLNVHNFDSSIVKQRKISNGFFRNYQNQGIGTRLLNKVITEAKKNNAVSLSGEMEGKIKMLSKWYKGFGFVIYPDNKIILIL